MPTTEAQKKAIRKYNSANTRQMSLNLSIQYDADILGKLDSVPNRQGYIKSLIRADIARSAQNKEEKEMKKELWYAVLLDREDNDWGTGSFDRNEAIKRAAREREDGNPDAYVAVINERSKVCVEEITDLEAYHVKPEFYSLWGEDTDENTIVTLDEVKQLADEWDKSISELLEQLEEI